MTATVAERDALVERLDGLREELAEMDERRARIAGQIERAQADQRITGQYADPDWFRRAKGALRHLGVERQQVEREIGDCNKRLRQLNGSLNQNAFYLAVRAEVDDVTWARIVARHEQTRPEGI